MHKLARVFGASAFVVKEVAVDEQQDCQVRIVARKAGLISWLLSRLGIDSTFTMRVFRDRIESDESSLSGRVKTVVPLKALDTYTCGFTKPIHLLVTGIIVAVIAIFCACYLQSKALAPILLLIAAGRIVTYFLRKCLVLEFTTTGANSIFFLFKRSVIEGVNVDEAFAEKVGELVKSNYLDQARK